MNRFGAYIGLIFIAYLPQLLNFYGPTQEFFRNSPKIELFSVTSNLVYTLGIVFCLAIIILSRLQNDSLVSREKYFPLQFTVGIIIFIFLFLLVFTDGIITVTFTLSLIPTILSAIIGFIGTYVVTCFYLRDCESSGKYHQIAMVAKLLNEKI